MLNRLNLTVLSLALLAAFVGGCDGHGHSHDEPEKKNGATTQAHGHSHDGDGGHE